MVKGLCGDGGEDPLTENDCFNKDGEIDDERLESYLMQDDDDDERKTKARIALAYMVGQRIKRKREVLLESERAKPPAQENADFTPGGILIRSQERGARRQK
ncbi:hypothetical protein MHU86_1982 [Fragilaria crotonensis]|nr:hypothetical protein MHU86_1982 [Fragilaria crotonensis]